VKLVLELDLSNDRFKLNDSNLVDGEEISDHLREVADRIGRHPVGGGEKGLIVVAGYSAGFWEIKG